MTTPEPTIEQFLAEADGIEREAAIVFGQATTPEALEQARIKYLGQSGEITALSKGMKQLREITGIPDITFYWARHTFANIARNKCRISKDDIAEALNHVDGEHRTTDIYIEKDWSIVDDVQSAVIEFIRNLDNLPPGRIETIPVNELTSPDLQRKTMRLVSA